MNNYKLANLWKRILGAIIDIIIVAITARFLLFLWTYYELINGQYYKGGNHEIEMIIFKSRIMFLAFVTDALYTITLLSSKKQSTYGQRVVGIKTIMLNGLRIRISTAISRWFWSRISAILFIGYIVACFTKHKQTFHDGVAETVVIDV